MKKRIFVTLAVTAAILMTAFTDVPKDYWGYEGISQAQSFGFINGVSKDNFEPTSTINKQEVAILVYRMHDLITSSTMGDLENVEYDEEKLKAAGVADWAYREISYGLVNNFWAVQDFGGADGGWADADRELIAKWLVQVSGFKSFGLKTLPYKDLNDISPEYYGYIDTLYKYGIMRGSDDGNFYPKDGIQRVEAAVAAVRVYNEKNAQISRIEKEPVIFKSGVVKNFNSKNLSFSIADETLFVDKDAAILLNGKISSFENFAMLSGKKMTVSSVICGENTDKIVVQTGPVSLKGKLKSLTSCKAVENTSVACIEIDAYDFDFIIDKDTEFINDIAEGEVLFITDGVYILEIK